jgi:hypothetical protein
VGSNPTLSAILDKRPRFPSKKVNLDISGDLPEILFLPGEID